MRIVGGALRGRGLAAPGRHVKALRPTSDRTRESLFNILEHGFGGFSLKGAIVLDLFAGTGALGLEALSRGAGFCLFVEDRAAARGLIRENIERLGLGGRTKVFRRDATQLGARRGVQAASLVLVDPPYGRGLGEKALKCAAAGDWLAEGALVVLEERASAEIGALPGFGELERRSYGDTILVFFSYGACED